MENLSGKRILITGATSGIGKETALALAKSGAEIIFTSRDVNRGNTVKEELVKSSGNPKIEMSFCDLSSFDSIRKFTQDFKSKFDKLDVLINNAGVWEVKFKESKDGIENTFAVNHLGYYMITNLLLDVLNKTAPARIVNVASNAHFRAVMRFDDIEFRNNFGSYDCYSHSKLANILFTKKLAKMLEGSGVTANSLHPGVIYTGLFRECNFAFKTSIRSVSISVEEGSRTSVFLASSPKVEGITGEYFSDCKLSDSSKVSKSIEDADRLWEISRRYTGL